MQSDYEVAREAGASSDPSWHSDSDESDATNTTACTPREGAQYGYRGTRVGRSTKNPGPYDSASTQPEPAIEGTLYAGCKDGTTFCLRASKVARDGRWQAGHKPRMTGSGREDNGGAMPNWLLKFGNRLRTEELHRLREMAEGKLQSAGLTHTKKSSIPAPSVESTRVTHLAHDNPPHSHCTSTDSHR